MRQAGRADELPSRAGTVVASLLLGRDGLLPKGLLDSDEQGRRMLKELGADLGHEHQGRLPSVSSYAGLDGAEVGAAPYPVQQDKSLLQNLQQAFEAWSLVLAPRPGLEPGTYGLTVRRSTD